MRRKSWKKALCLVGVLTILGGCGKAAMEGEEGNTDFSENSGQSAENPESSEGKTDVQKAENEASENEHFSCEFYTDINLPVAIDVEDIGCSGVHFAELDQKEQRDWLEAFIGFTFSSDWSIANEEKTWSEFMEYMPDRVEDFGEDGALYVYRLKTKAMSAYGSSNIMLIAVLNSEITDIKYFCGNYSAVGYIWDYPDYVLYLREGELSQFGIYYTYFAGEVALLAGKIELYPEADQYFSVDTVMDDDGNIYFMRTHTDRN